MEEAHQGGTNPGGMKKQSKACRRLAAAGKLPGGAVLGQGRRVTRQPSPNMNDQPRMFPPVDELEH